jgi:hypothetical protein
LANNAATYNSLRNSIVAQSSNSSSTKLAHSTQSTNITLNSNDHGSVSSTRHHTQHTTATTANQHTSTTNNTNSHTVLVMATAASDMLDEYNGDVSAVVNAIGGNLLAPHMDVHKITRHHSGNGTFPKVSQLTQIATAGAPVVVESGGDLCAEISRGNHSSAQRLQQPCVDKVHGDLRVGKAFIITKQAALKHLKGRLRVAPVGVIQERADKFRIIHDLSASLAAFTSVNQDTDFDSAPPVQCGTVIRDVINRIWQLRQRYTGLPIVISKIDFTSAFRQVKVDTTVCYLDTCVVTWS